MPEPPAFYHTVQLQIFEFATAPQAIPESSDKCVLFGLHRLRQRPAQYAKFALGGQPASAMA